MSWIRLALLWSACCNCFGFAIAVTKGQAVPAAFTAVIGLGAVAVLTMVMRKGLR